ncbi:unnamed protein product [Mytilus coruscus]|uniref:DUF6451 domain-containing protein n=1 Tax=Mytilus coruscus TaxID=42192 RepID=A0A6J8CM26_MYTCO|nr:unnamed protein product [Mytilus coruscus]
MKVKTRKGGTVSIEGEDIEEVDQFTYLGSIMDRNGGTDADIRTRISKARQAFAMLKPVWKSTAFTENTKIRIFNTNVKSVLFYGAETWRLTAGEPAIKQLKRRTWQWIGHTLRKPVGSITRQALEWNPQGHRRPGRPFHSWRRSRRKELEEIGYTWSEAKRIAQNRVRWKATVAALCSTRNEED